MTEICQKCHGTLSIGLLTSKINLEGPIVKGKTSFNISARRSYLDLIAKPFMPDDEEYSYYFYDINAKINHKFSDRSRVYLSAYNGKDHFAANYDGNTDFKDGSKMNWGNTILSCQMGTMYSTTVYSAIRQSPTATIYSTSTHIPTINISAVAVHHLPTGIQPITVRESMIGITRSTSIIIHLPNTTSNLEQDISIIVSARKL